MAMLEILISDPQAMIQMDKYLSCSSITVLFKISKWGNIVYSHIFRLGLEFKIGHSIRYKILIPDSFELLVFNGIISNENTIRP